MNDAPRITAGYDADEPRTVFFPAADRGSGNDHAELDVPATALVLAQVLTAVCGLPAQAEAAAGEPQPLEGWSAGDGSSCAIGGGWRLAAAMLNRRCGGPFAGDAATGSAHVARCRDALIATVRAALLPEGADWCAGLAVGRATAFAVRVGDVSDRIDIHVAHPAVPVVSDGDWSARLAALLAGLVVPVRLVLHEGPFAVRAARALAVGDVLPIATAHEVGLRVGTLGLARGEVIDADTGTPRVRIAQRNSIHLRHREPA